MNPQKVLPLMLVPTVLLATTPNEPETAKGKIISVELYPTSAMVSHIVDFDLKASPGQCFAVTDMPSDK